MAQMHLLTGTLVDLGLSPLADRTPYVVVKTNMPGGHPVMDSTGHVVLPTTRVAVNAAGEWSVSLIDTSATDLNIEPDTLQYTLIAEGAPEGMRQPGAVKVGPFPLTSSQRIDQVDTDSPAVSPSWRSAFRDEMEALEAQAVSGAKAEADRAEAAADLAVDISQIAVPDDVVKVLIQDPGSETSGALNAAIGQQVDPIAGATVRPSSFPGTDAEKLQSAIEACIANGYPTIVLDKWYDLTGADAISIDKPNWYDRDKIIITADGGGIAKHDAGIVFTTGTANTGDLSFIGVSFASTPGAGAVLIDGDKLIRNDALKCEFRGWDHYVVQSSTSRWAQSIRVLDCTIIDGAGAFIRFHESYDITARDCLVEDRRAKGEQAMFIENTTAAMTTLANRNLRILNNTVENCARVPIKLAMCWSAALDLNYFEHNGNDTDPQIDLWTLATNTRQTGVRLSNNMIQQKPGQIANRVGAVWVGPNRTIGTDWITSVGNVSSGGVLYEFKHPTGVVFSSGDAAENGGLVVFPGQEHQIFTPGHKSGDTASRPRSVRPGRDLYYDTTLGKLLVATATGTTGVYRINFNAGATTAGTITITLLGVPYTVTVAAGDTAQQVRDKVAASPVFWPTWKPTPSASTPTSVLFYAYRPGLLPSSIAFDAGGTGVTQNLLARDVMGSDATWVGQAAVFTGSTSLDFPSIPAGASAALDVSVPGAAYGDTVTLGTPSLLDGLIATAFVQSAGTVRVRLTNTSSAAVDPIASAWTVKVIR